MILRDEVIYVGQSADVRKRLLAHFNTDARLQEVEKNKDHQRASYIVQKERYECIRDNWEEIYYLYIPTPIDQLNTLEEYYIKKHKPIYNYAGVKCEYSGVERFTF